MNRVRKIIVAVAGSLLICCLGLVAIALVTPDSQETEAEPVLENRSQEQDIEIEEELEPTVTNEPTELPATDIPTSPSTKTPQPTNTPKPTGEPPLANTATSLPPTSTNTPLPTNTLPPPSTATSVIVNTQPPPPTATSAIVNTQPPPPTATPIIVNTESPPNPSGCVSINNAGVEDLKRIIHIDDTRALDLIANRPYSSLNQLTRIKGIGPARLEDILAEGIACLP